MQIDERLFGTFLAAMATAVGALPVLFFRKKLNNQFPFLLGLSAGIMMAASFVSLLLPAFEQIENGERLLKGIFLLLAFVAGAWFVLLMDRFLPHEHFVKGREGTPGLKIHQAWLFVIAICIHNFPEGLAVGVGFGGTQMNNAVSLALAIAFQNIPEGFIVAFSLIAIGYSSLKAFGMAFLSGLFEFGGGVVGLLSVSFTTKALGVSLAFAAGAMICVVSSEMIPESHRSGGERRATWGIIMGVLVMMLLNHALA